MDFWAITFFRNVTNRFGGRYNSPIATYRIARSVDQATAIAEAKRKLAEDAGKERWD